MRIIRELRRMVRNLRVHNGTLEDILERMREFRSAEDRQAAVTRIIQELVADFEKIEWRQERIEIAWKGEDGKDRQYSDGPDYYAEIASFEVALLCRADRLLYGNGSAVEYTFIVREYASPREIVWIRVLGQGDTWETFERERAADWPAKTGELIRGLYRAVNCREHEFRERVQRGEKYHASLRMKNRKKTG